MVLDKEFTSVSAFNFNKCKDEILASSLSIVFISS